LAFIDIILVGFAGVVSPGGMEIGFIPLAVSILLVSGLANHPCTINPFGSTKLPFASNVKSPALVYLYVFPPSSLTTKNHPR